MPKRRSGKSATPVIFNELSPPLARRFLERHRPHLGPHGVLDDEPFNPAALARVLGEVEPDAPLTRLLEEIAVVEELARERYRDLLHAHATAFCPQTVETPSTADLVVLLMIHKHAALEEVYAERLLVDHHAHETHMPPSGSPLNIMCDPTEAGEAIRAAVEAELLEREKCGGVMVYVFITEDGFRLVIRRGDPLRRLAAVDPGSGERRHLRFHKENFDTIEFRRSTGELRTHTGSIANTKMYVRAVGRHVFGDALTFVTNGPPAKYTLDPILKHGAECLRCSDVHELERVQLIGLTWEYPGPIDLKLRGTAKKNLFDSVRMAGLSPFAAVKLVAARFKFTFRGRRRTATASITLPNRASVSNESDRPVIDAWFDLRAFTKNPQEATRGLTHPALAAP